MDQVTNRTVIVPWRVARQCVGLRTPCPTPVWQEFLSSATMNTVRKSLTEDAATTMVHAFVSSWVDYCNSVLQRVSAAIVQPLQNVLNCRCSHHSTAYRIQSVRPGVQVSA